MKEIEVKILEINRAGYENKILILGGEKTFDGKIRGIIFDKEGELKENRILLRLRYENDKSVLTLKHKCNDGEAKSADEYEVEVSDFEITKKILEELGYVSKDNVEKHRTEYEVDDVKFCFDKYSGEYGYVPEFLEIEAKDEETLFRYVKLLDIDKEDCKAWSGWDVIKHYEEKKSIDK